MIKLLKHQFLYLRRQVLVLILMVLAILILAGGFSAAGSVKMREGNLPPISLSVVAKPEDEMAQMLLKQLSFLPLLFPNIDLIVEDTEEEARSAVSNGELSAALLLPHDFYAWVNGESNENPVLLVDSISGMEHAVFRTIGNSMLSMLSDAQRGIMLTLQAVDFIRPNNLSYDRAWQEINLIYFSTAFDQSDRFLEEVVTGPNSFSIASHYMFCISLCFCILTTPLFYRKLSLKGQGPWIRRLQSIGVSSRRYMLSQLLSTALVYLLMLLLLSSGYFAVLRILGEAPQIALWLVPTLVLASVFLAVVSFFLSNLNNPTLGGVLVSFFALFGLLTAGGLLPLPLLPALFTTISKLSPILWLRDLLGASFLGLGAAPWKPMSALLLLISAIALLLLLQCRQFRRKDL